MDRVDNQFFQRVGAVSTFLQQVEKIEYSNKKNVFYRGHSKKDYSPLPSIFRKDDWINNEAKMFNELVMRCPNDFPNGITAFESLVKMQHYGLPTRLLDVTTNPLVALYFACNPSNGDGEVLMFEFPDEDIKYFNSDTVATIANLAKRPNFELPEDNDIEGFNQNDDVRLLLHEIKHDKPHFDNKINPSDMKKVICVKPKLSNPRIIKQDGAFLLFGCQESKQQPAQLSESVIKHRFTIKNDKKRQIKSQLALLGVSQSTLFPEIDRVAEQIRNDYLDRGNDKNSELTGREQSVLEVLRAHRSLSTSDIAAKLGLSTNTINTVLKTLREKGLVDLAGTVKNGIFKSIHWGAFK